MIRLLASLCLLLVTLPVMANEEVVLGLSQNRVAITANFDGSEILIFGAVKRETKIPKEQDIEVIVAVSGPSSPVTVRRKERKLGIWVNTESLEVHSAPSFYAVATSGPLKQILADVEDLRHQISVPRAIRAVGAPIDVQNAKKFTDAIIRIRENKGLYQLQEETVQVDQQTLFRTRIAMPANLTEGDYIARVFLTRDGAVVSQYETTIDVSKVGLERWLYNLSRQQPLIYGLLSLTIAIVAGWGASAVFRMFQQG